MASYRTITEACDAIIGNPDTAPVTDTNILLIMLKKICEQNDNVPPPNTKCATQLIFACANANPRDILPYMLWEDQTTKDICVVPFGENPNTNAGAIIPNFINEYTMKQTPANLTDKVLTTQVCITDCDTGAIVRGFECINFDTMVKQYYDADMALLNGDGTLTASQVAGKNPVSRPVGSENIQDVTTTATALGSVPANAGYALIQATGAPIVYTVDGTAPDVSDPDNIVGMVVSEGGLVELCSAKDIAAFQFISLNGQPADINVTYKNVQQGTGN